MFTTCAGLLLAGCTTKHIAYQADSTLSPKLRAQSVPVWLPRTVLEFRCVGTVTTVEPSLLYEKATAQDGEKDVRLKRLYQEAAELGLGVNPNKAVTQYSLKEPTLSARGERDPEAMFYVKMDGGLFSKVEFTGQFAPDGIPGTLSSSAENKGFEFAMKTIEVAAGVVGKAVSILAMAAPSTNAPPDDFSTLLEHVSARLGQLREARQALVTGQSLAVQVDEKTLAKMLEEIAKAEESLTAYFTGASTQRAFPLIVTIRPKPCYNPSFPLLRFDASSGFAMPDEREEVHVSPIPPSLEAKSAPAQQVVLEFAAQKSAENQMWEILKGASASKRGLPYRVPARSHACVVLLDVQGKEVRRLLAADALIAQWGEVGHLPPSMDSVGSAFKPTYYTDTGSLKELTVTSSALSPDSLGSLDRATGSITDVLREQAARAATAAKDKAAKQDELNQLEREGDILEQELRIQQLREKLPITVGDD